MCTRGTVYQVITDKELNHYANHAAIPNYMCNYCDKMYQGPYLTNQSVPSAFSITDIKHSAIIVHTSQEPTEQCDRNTRPSSAPPERDERTGTSPRHSNGSAEGVHLSVT